MVSIVYRRRRTRRFGLMPSERGLVSSPRSLGLNPSVLRRQYRTLMIEAGLMPGASVSRRHGRPLLAIDSLRPYGVDCQCCSTSVPCQRPDDAGRGGGGWGDEWDDKVRNRRASRWRPGRPSVSSHASCRR